MSRLCRRERPLGHGRRSRGPRPKRCCTVGRRTGEAHHGRHQRVGHRLRRRLRHYPSPLHVARGRCCPPPASPLPPAPPPTSSIKRRLRHWVRRGASRATPSPAVCALSPILVIIFSVVGLVSGLGRRRRFICVVFYCCCRRWWLRCRRWCRGRCESLLGPKRDRIRAKACVLHHVRVGTAGRGTVEAEADAEAEAGLPSAAVSRATLAASIALLCFSLRSRNPVKPRSSGSKTCDPVRQRASTATSSAHGLQFTFIFLVRTSSGRSPLRHVWSGSPSRPRLRLSPGPASGPLPGSRAAGGCCACARGAELKGSEKGSAKGSAKGSDIRVDWCPHVSSLSSGPGRRIALREGREGEGRVAGREGRHGKELQ
jgi:hypothetical protein